MSEKHISATSVPRDDQADAELEQYANRAADLEQAGYTFIIDLAAPRKCRHGWVRDAEDGRIGSRRFVSRPAAVNDAWRHYLEAQS